MFECDVSFVIEELDFDGVGLIWIEWGSRSSNS